MKRYHLYRGVAGHLVAHPFAGVAPGGEFGVERSGRYAGKRMMTRAELLERYGTEQPTLQQAEWPARYVDVEEVLECQSDGALEKAVRAGELVRVRGPVVALNLIEAQKAFAAAPSASTAPSMPTAVESPTLETEAPSVAHAARKSKHGGNS
jgi:hypothetical protein